MTGSEYANLIAQYIVKNYGGRGLEAYREVSFGKTIIGKNRRIDVFVVRPGTPDALAIECKYQDSLGTVDEKIPYTLDDLESLRMPACVTYAGQGFSSGILHMLAASPIAAYCLPAGDLAPSNATRELDHVLAMTFKWWDLVLTGKPVTVL
ncbi:MAG: hypothetical protein IPK60_15405 [Sandaracinaceae bacterium]|jgi:hypothetical protein|nr:hypothetical protein [Sandaracinaceae bacterium]